MLKAEYIVYLCMYINTSCSRYLLEQHSDAFEIWSAIILINTKKKALIMKLGPG